MEMRGGGGPIEVAQASKRFQACAVRRALRRSKLPPFQSGCSGYAARYEENLATLGLVVIDHAVFGRRADGRGSAGSGTGGGESETGRGSFDARPGGRSSHLHHHRRGHFAVNGRERGRGISMDQGLG